MMITNEYKFSFYRTPSHLLVGVYFFCVLVWPEFIKINLIPGAAGFTATRIIFIIISPFVCHILIQRFKNIINDSYVFPVFLLSILLFLCLLVSVSFSNYSTSSFKQVFFVLENTIVFGLVLYLFYDEYSKEYYLKILLLAVSVATIIGVWEWIAGGGILEPFILYKDDTIEALVFGQDRDGIHRLSSVYLNPLSFAAHLLAFAPIMVSFLKRMRGLWRMAALANLVVIPFLVYGTDSRLAIFMCLLVYTYFGLSYLYLKTKNVTTVVIIPILLIIVLYLFIDYDMSDYFFLVEDRFMGGQSRMGSLEQRFEQYSVVFFKIFSSFILFLFGLGFGAANEIVYPLASVDNIYLSIFLEGGFLSFLTIVSLFFCLVRPGLFCQRSPLSSELLFSLLLIFVYFLISSSKEVFACAFMLFVLLLHERKFNR